VLKGVAVRGSYLGTKQDLEDVFQLAESGAVKPKVTHTKWQRRPPYSTAFTVAKSKAVP
jgi:D-arabinose 1-dehydrogenase-like Zn-dependent alcohol dehydrogenase